MKLLKSYWPVVLITIIAYWQFFAHKKVPMPGDLMVGAYYPWLDYKWGYSVGVAVKNPVISDVFSQFFPWKYLIVEQLQKGVLPLWNQFSFSGIPLLGSYSSAAFFPFNVLLFLPKYSGWGFYIAGQSFAALLGLYLFLGKYTKSKTARVGGSVVFAFSGLMTTWAEFGTGVWAAAMIPWVLFAIDSFIDTKKYRYLFLSAFALASLYLAGHSQLNVYSSLLIGIYLLFLLYRKEISVKHCFPIGVSFLVAGGLAAIELLPAFHQMALSVRAAEAYSKTFNYGLTPVHDLIMTFVADFFGNPTTLNFWGDISYHECISFLGTLTIPLVLPLLWNTKKHNKKIGFWLSVFGISLFLAVDSPITQFLYKQPWPLLTYSSASRILFLTSLSGGVLVTLGLDELMSGNKAYRKRLSMFSVALLLTILLAFVLLQHKAISPLHFQVSLRNTVLPAFILLFTLLLTSIKKISPRVIAVVLVLILSFDLIHFFQKYNPFVEEKLVFPVTPVISFLQSDTSQFRIGRLDQEVITPNSWMPYHLSSVEGYDPLSYEHYSRYFNRVNGNSYNDSVNRYTQIFRPDFTFLESLNVKYYLDVLDRNKVLATKNRLTEVYRDKSVTVYEDLKVMPRAYFVNTVMPVSSQKEMVTELDKNTFDPRNTALVVNSLQTEQWSRGEAYVSSYTDNNLEIDTSNSGTGFLVVADSYEDGWQVTVDGKKATLYEVNGALRGVIVPPGKHHVEMNYWPSAVKWGFRITAVSIIFSFGYFVYLLLQLCGGYRGRTC